MQDHINFKNNIKISHYLNGQMALFVHNQDGEPIAELSIKHDILELAPNEFILKDYSENKDLAQEFLSSKLFIPTNRFILIGSHLCPICQIEA